MKINIEIGGLHIFSNADGTGEVSLHATRRQLETKVKHFEGDPDENREPFSTLEFLNEEGGRICLFLGSEQLETLAIQLGEEIAGRKE